MNLSDLLSLSIKEGASDLHLSSGLSPILRIDGDLVRTDLPAMSSDHVDKLIYEVLNDRQIATIEEGAEVDFSFEIPHVARFRANVFNQNRGRAAAFRSISADVATLDELDLGEVFEELCLKPRGLVLITGPTGSGKSKTQAAMVDHINKNRAFHILTIEDPIEFIHQDNKSIISQREIGRDTKNFSAALRAALREDPDVILVGEMRDLETIGLALTAAETGHLVFGTLHTNGAPSTISRIIDAFPSEQQSQVRTQLSDALAMVVTQNLFRKKDDSGRVGAFEVLVSTPGVRNLIRENKVHQLYSTMQTSQQDGMITLEKSIEDLIIKGLINPITK